MRRNCFINASSNKVRFVVNDSIDTSSRKVRIEVWSKFASKGKEAMDQDLQTLRQCLSTIEQLPSVYISHHIYHPLLL